MPAPSLGRDRLIDVGQPAEVQPQLTSLKALTAPAVLPLGQVNRPVASLAGIRAVSSVQPSSAITAGAHEDRAGWPETGPDPDDAEALHMAVAAHEFEAGDGKPQIGKVGVFEFDMGLIDCIRIARNSVAQFIDID